MKIAIIDNINHDIGLKILFPEADYYASVIEIDKTASYNKYGFRPIITDDYSSINDKIYDTLFVVCATYDVKENTKFFKPLFKKYFDKTIDLINNNNFKTVAWFDVYDYDYDPNDIIKNDKVNFIFKRNYNSEVKYKSNVYPFPFIMFGPYSIIEKIDNYVELTNKKNGRNKLFFAGQLLTHIDTEYNIIRDRRKMLDSIINNVDFYHYLNYEEFLTKMNEYKYSLDLLGVGEPNKRTFEILSTNSLRIAEKNNLVWPFPDKFCEETYFENSKELDIILKNLNENVELYNKCLSKQKEIFKIYINKTWISNYINNIINRIE